MKYFFDTKIGEKYSIFKNMETLATIASELQTSFVLLEGIHEKLSSLPAYLADVERDRQEETEVKVPGKPLIPKILKQIQNTKRELGKVAKLYHELDEIEWKRMLAHSIQQLEAGEFQAFDECMDELEKELDELDEAENHAQKNEIQPQKSFEDTLQALLNGEENRFDLTVPMEQSFDAMLKVHHKIRKLGKCLTKIEECQADSNLLAKGIREQMQTLFEALRGLWNLFVQLDDQELHRMLALSEKDVEAGRVVTLEECMAHVKAHMEEHKEEWEARRLARKNRKRHKIKSKAKLLAKRLKKY
jgi:hypothetical protein